MPQPLPYTRNFSFTDDEAQSPNDHVPGVSLDAEFDGVADTLKGILGNLLKIQRDDGQLKNMVVTLDSLSPAVIYALGAGGSWTPKGAWQPATDYAVSDVVEVGTATYVCAIAGVSGATFAEAAAGVWIKLFDDAGTIPADGSVTSAKIAPGAVDDNAIGFTTFDITGAGRAQGGLAAGTAPKGALLHAKAAAGDVHAKIERSTDAQGAVGYKIIGVGATWALEMASDVADLRLTVGGVTVLTVGAATKVADFKGAVRVFAAEPTEGTGINLSFAAGIGSVTSRDYDNDAWRDLKMRGKVVYLQASGVDVLKTTSTGVDILAGKTLTLNGVPVGYLGIPENPQDAAYVITAADIGKSIYSQNAVAQTITVPVLPDDSAVVVVNDGAAPITLQAGAGVTLRLAGTATTGNRTIGAGGMAFIKWVKDGTRVFVSGAGVS